MVKGILVQSLLWVYHSKSKPRTEPVSLNYLLQPSQTNTNNFLGLVKSLVEDTRVGTKGSLYPLLAFPTPSLPTLLPSLRHRDVPFRRVVHSTTICRTEDETCPLEYLRHTTFLPDIPVSDCLSRALPLVGVVGRPTVVTHQVPKRLSLSFPSSRFEPGGNLSFTVVLLSDWTPSSTDGRRSWRRPVLS